MADTSQAAKSSNQSREDSGMSTAVLLSAATTRLRARAGVARMPFSSVTGNGSVFALAIKTASRLASLPSARRPAMIALDARCAATDKWVVDSFARAGQRANQRGRDLRDKTRGIGMKSVRCAIGDNAAKIPIHRGKFGDSLIRRGIGIESKKRQCRSRRRYGQSDGGNFNRRRGQHSGL